MRQREIWKGLKQSRRLMPLKLKKRKKRRKLPNKRRRKRLKRKLRRLKSRKPRLVPGLLPKSRLRTKSMMRRKSSKRKSNSEINRLEIRQLQGMLKIAKPKLKNQMLIKKP